MKLAIVTVLALAVASPALAAEVNKKDKVPAPAVSSKAMTHAEMDKVTAGTGVDNTVYLPSQGYSNAAGATSTGNNHASQAAQFNCCR